MICLDRPSPSRRSGRRARPRLSRAIAASLFALAGWTALSLSESVPAAASTYYVSPTGLPSNDGSLGSPLDLATALSSQGPVRPGDTVWLRGGVYRRAASLDSHGDPVVYVSTLNGTAAAPIVVRQYPGERATLDGNLASSVPVLVVQGSYTWYWGFEITNSNPSRSSTRGTGLDSYGHHNRYINLIIHDAGNGVGFWATSAADDSEIYGSVISHVGWEASDRGHGHSIYVQNVNGVKRIVDNILFESFSFGIHAYTSNSRLDNLTMTGNIAFNHGNLSAGSGPKANILFAGDQVAQNPIVTGNYSYYPAGSDGRGLDVSLCNNGRLQSNYLAGGTPLRLGSCSSTVISGNTMFGPVAAATQAAYPSNTYGTTPSGVWVGIRPNTYEPGRANVVIYNWANAPSVGVDLAAAGITVGNTYEIRDAQNYFGPVLFSGAYTGQALFPMTGLTAAPVVGSVPIQPGHTSAQFGAFVVRRISGGTPPPGAMLLASPAAIAPGGSATLSWTTSGAASVAIDQGIGAVASSGSRAVTPAATTTYTLTATNAGGATTATAVVTVNATAPPPNVPPTVSLTAPSGGSVFNPGAVTVRATASDTNGTVARVDFRAGTQLIGSDSTNPYEVTWTAGPVGPYSLTAVAVDNQNASTTSTAVPVSVVAAAGGGVNVALASNGATATASSSYYAAGYQPPAAIDGRRSGAIRGQLGTWEDASSALPDWFQVSFAGPSTINRVNVVSMQEAWSTPVEPTTTLTSGLAAADFHVQYWNGAAWVVVPGSQVVGNTLVWKQVSFAPVTTSAIRIVVTSVAGGITRLTEVEAWTSGSAPGPIPPTNAPPTVSLTAPSGGSVFTPAAAVTVRATAGDTNGTVARVEFFAGTQLIGTDTGSPYEVTWTAGPPGSYSLTAVAVDNQNASTTSTAVPVSVAAAAGGGVNVALAGSGATATASSTYTTDYAARAAIDGRRSGAIRGQLGTWEDASGALPDWFQVTFAAPSTINRVNVFSMQEAWSAPVEPTSTLTSGLAAEDFQVQYWNGAAWVVVPGSQVVGNRLVWKQVSFAPVTTSAIRIVVTKVSGGITRLAEVEAWTP